MQNRQKKQKDYVRSNYWLVVEGEKYRLGKWGDKVLRLVHRFFPVMKFSRFCSDNLGVAKLYEETYIYSECLFCLMSTYLSFALSHFQV
jgi:hypothetical protein